jgi:hypothetical protein
MSWLSYRIKLIHQEHTMNDLEQTVAGNPYSHDGMIMFPPGTLIEYKRRIEEAEREACALACEKIEWSHEAKFFAKAIRARGKNE